MTQTKTSIAVACALALLAGCGDEASDTNKGTATVGQQPSAPATPSLPAFANLGAFNGKAPNDLLQDASIAAAFRKIVPQADFKCLDSVFNQLSDLRLRSDGALQAEANGSHAEQFAEGFVSIASRGQIHVVLKCDAAKPGEDEKYLYFSNQKIDTSPPDDVKAWLYNFKDSNTILTRSDGTNSQQMQFADFFKRELAAAAPTRPAATNSPVVSKESSSSLGAIQGKWSCANDRNNGSSQISFKPDGALEWVDNPGRNTSSSRLGIYRQTDLKLDIVIQQMPALSRLGRSPNVSIKEGGEIKTATSDTLRFTWWQNDDPNDRMQIACNKTSERVTDNRPREPRVVQMSSSGKDRVAQYADNIAAQMERSSHPACSSLANTIRSVGNSGTPDSVRARQVDSMVNRAPSGCFDPRLRR
jgi:hypothetical protein